MSIGKRIAALESRRQAGAVERERIERVERRARITKGGHPWVSYFFNCKWVFDLPDHRGDGDPLEAIRRRVEAGEEQPEDLTSEEKEVWEVEESIRDKF